MKLSALVALLGLSLTACTIEQTKPSPGGGDASETPSESAAGESPGKAEEPAPEPGTPGAPVPGSIVGSWSWITQHGGQTLTFEIGGGYSNDVFLDGHPGDSCGVEYFTQRKGTATFTENTLRLRSTESTRTKMDSCKGTTLGTETIDPQDDSYAWRIDADDRGEDVLILERDGSTTTYYRATEE